MKKILLLLLILFLGVNYANAQTTSKLIKTWVLQNPELAVNHTVVTFYADGQMLFQFSNLLTKKSGSSKSSWKLLDAKKNILLITDSEGKSYQVDFMISDNTMTMTSHGDDIANANYFAVSGSSSDYYMSRVQFAVDTYGTDASLKKNGMASSSAETGYSFQPRYSNCFACAGLGRCTYCYGTGRTTYNFRDYVTCSSCRGTGTCYLCGGKGKLKNY